MKKLISILMFVLIICTSLFVVSAEDDTKAKMQALYGENQQIEDYDKNLSAKCNNGTFVGKSEESILSFKGIPYAKSPTGDLRWKKAELPENSRNVYEAYYYGKSPIQTEWVSEVGSYYKQGEDCLTLNVWNNTSDKTENKTVMVFFHGGSYGWGGTSDPMYDGTNFVSRNSDVILVTVGYRTGIMGFIDFSSVEGGEDYKESGNLGLLDMVCALKWINQNISAFGGSTENITIFGESAGAGAVSLIPLIDEADGLYNRVIAESGSVALTFSKDECQDFTAMLLDETGCTNMNELMALSEEELMKANENLNDYNNFPERDGIVLPENLYDAYKNGEAAKVDMLIGTNEDEACYWKCEMGYYVNGIDGEILYNLGLPIMYDMNMKRVSKEDKQSVSDFFDIVGESKISNITEFYNEVMFRVPAILQTESHSDNGNDTYMYYWTYPSSIKGLGACHAVELIYVFNNLDVTIYNGDNINEGLAETVGKMWTNFAKTGNPSTEEIKWEKFDSETGKTMMIGDDIHMEENWLSEQREKIEPIIKYNFNGSYMESLSLKALTTPTGIKYMLAVLALPLAIVCTIIAKKKRKNKKEK